MFFSFFLGDGVRGQGRSLCFIPHQKIEQQWTQTVTSPNLPYWVISVSLILWMLSVHKTQSFVKWSLDLWNMRNTCVMVREVSLFVRDALYQSPSQRFGGELWTSATQSGNRQKCRQTHHWALNFLADSPWAKSPIFDFHVPNNAICFPTKLCIRFAINFLMDDC